MPKLEPWTVATVFGVVGLAYVLGPTISHTSKSQSQRRTSKVTVGLANRANECFINSNLQALAAIDLLREYLDDALQGDNPKLILTAALRSMIAALNEPVASKTTLSSWPVLHALEQVHNSRVSTAQHDAHEMLHILLETIESETNSLKSPFPFSGSTVDRITCSTCKHTSNGPCSPFLVLSLIVPQRRTVSLESLLTTLCQPEYIGDYSCINCRLSAAGKSVYSQYTPDTVPPQVEASLPQMKSSIVKTTHFDKLPRILVLHLSRSIYQGYGASRNACKVAVKEHLHVQDVSYTLSALVRHKGTHSSGHYECFRRKQADNKINSKYEWWQVSDDASCECTTKQVLRDQSGAYLLFYEKDNNNN